jgi:phospholipid/cholesterol/gamma-HCH transport system substrate-binding protein
MAQRRQLTWSELRVGLFVLAGVALVLAGIFYVTGSGFLGAKYQLVTYLPEVEGLAIGSPVAVAGVEVGNVDSIRIASPPPGRPVDMSRNIEVVMKIQKNFQNYIRSDSLVSLSTQGFLGDRTVDIQRGYTGRVLQDGDEISGKEEQAFKQVIERSSDLMANLNTLTTQLNNVVRRIDQGEGTIGKLLTDDTMYNHINQTMQRVDDLTAGIQQGRGTVGKLMSSDTLYTKIDSAVGRLDNVLAAVVEQRGTLGKMVYDPSIHDSAKQFLGNSNAVLSDVRSGRGTLGKLATDDSLFNTFRATAENLKDATAQMNSNQTTVGKLFTDPKLYDNLSGLTGDMRLFMGEFRQNPRKFLRIKLSLF